jgi:uncharacterized membrane protein YeaQ/YmgE (transglycosylase-associated protein family)
MNADIVLGWAAIGAAASLAGMIWPFRRGALGVVVNLVAGIAGAVVVALLSLLVLPGGERSDTPARLLFAALGALAALGLVHAGWTRHVRGRLAPRG